MTSQEGTWPLVCFRTFPSSLDDLGSPVPSKVFDLFSLSDTKDIRTPGNIATMMWDLIWCEIIPKPCLIPRRRDIRQAARTQTPRNDLLYAQCSTQQGIKSQRVAKKSRYITEKRWCICLHSLCYCSNFTVNVPSIAVKLGGGRCC